jgi:oligopeptide/dipeptide ABC transporter ATP-binding protein
LRTRGALPAGAEGELIAELEAWSASADSAAAPAEAAFPFIPVALGAGRGDPQAPVRHRIRFTPHSDLFRKANEPLLLLRELQKEKGMSVIFVTHDIGAAVEVADRIAVMYAGRIVEMGDVAQVVHQPQHPYTQGLLASTVSAEDKGKPLIAVPGSPPDLSNLPQGCSFAARCSQATVQCQTQVPLTTTTGQSDLACWNPILMSQVAR